MKTCSLVLALALIDPFILVAQGTFRNMDFEQAQIPQNQAAGFVDATLAFPFWTVFNDSIPQTQVLWNNVSVGSTQASLLGQSDHALDGGYSAFLFGGSGACSISQVGQVPTDAISLLFKVQIFQGQQINVSMGGVSLPVFDISTGPNYAVYGVNVSQFEGMQEQLQFTAPSGPNYWNIDDITFSTTAVPEPSAGGLLAFGGLLLSLRILRRKE